MWIDNSIFKEDMEFVATCESVGWANLENATVLVTGATGLIGSTIVSSLIYVDRKKNLNLKVIALVRNLEKAKMQFASHIAFSNALSFVEGTVEDLPCITGDIDYIIHGASPTASAFFVEHPVETINIAVQGTTNLLNLAVKKAVKGFVYLSSMEVYGAPQTDDLILESEGTTIDTMSVRSSYPEAKRLCECLCTSYAMEYDVPAKVVRLAQTFGPGVSIKDVRLFAEMARCVIDNKDIVLKTMGTSKRCYLYTADSATAILTILLSGKTGEAYNAANRDTYCSIIQMANMVKSKLANDAISVVTPDNGFHDNKYPPDHILNLSAAKIMSLGWASGFALIDMFKRMIATMKV